jgi:hypothetical protein
VNVHEYRKDSSLSIPVSEEEDQPRMGAKAREEKTFNRRWTQISADNGGGNLIAAKGTKKGSECLGSVGAESL